MVIPTIQDKCKVLLVVRARTCGNSSLPSFYPMGQFSSRTQDPVQTKRVIVGVFERFPRGTHTTQSIEEWWSDIVGSDGYFGSRLDELTDCKVAQIELHRSSSPPEHEFILAHIHYTKMGVHQSRIIYIGCNVAHHETSPVALIASICPTRSAPWPCTNPGMGFTATFHWNHVVPRGECEEVKEREKGDRRRHGTVTEK